MIDAEQCDLYDVLAYIRFKVEPLRREQRAENCREFLITQYPDEELQTFLDFVLRQYVSGGVTVLGQDKLPKLLELKYQSATEGSRKLGGAAFIRDTFRGFQKSLYAAP